MEPIVSIAPEKCTNCFTCVRICPVKAIMADTESPYPGIKVNRCIGCGSCIESCIPEAISYRSSLGAAREVLQSDDIKAVVVSTSVSAEFDDITDYRKFVQMIRSLGVDHVYEMSFGTDLIASKYANFFNDFKGRYYITSTDPVIVNFIEKYHPNLINNLAPFVSPMIAMAKVIRKKHIEPLRIIYVGPNIASKDEALRFNDEARIDCVITFPELRQLFGEYSIDENTVDFSEFDPPLGYKGSLYPVSNGLIQAADIDENLLSTHVICVEGEKAMIGAIDEFENNVKAIHRHLHVSYGNTLSGPGISGKGNKLYKEHLVIKFANKRIQNFYRTEWYNNLTRFGKLDFSRKFRADDQRIPEPTPEKIQEALNILGIKSEEAMNCNQCGYSSCREFAVDMAKGIVIPEMCSTYSIQTSKNFSSKLKELNEKLSRSKFALKEAEDKFHNEHDSATQASELTNAMLDKLRAGIVIVDYQLKIIKANNTFCSILGEEAEEINSVMPGLVGADLKKLFHADIYNLFTYVISNSESIDGRDVYHGDSLLNISIFSIRENQIAGGIIRDMKAPEVQRAEVIKRVTEVIDKNLEMVQKIGFLLGESAADIEHMLNSIIQFYQRDKENRNRSTMK